MLTIEQRLYEWCIGARRKAESHRQELDVTHCFAPLLCGIMWRSFVITWAGIGMVNGSLQGRTATPHPRRYTLGTRKDGGKHHYGLGCMPRGWGKRSGNARGEGNHEQSERSDVSVGVDVPRTDEIP